MPAAPRDWYWHVRDWKPTGKRAYEQVRHWRRGTYIALMIEEVGVEQHIASEIADDKTITRWRRATVTDVCDQILAAGATT